MTGPCTKARLKNFCLRITQTDLDICWNMSLLCACAMASTYTYKNGCLVNCCIVHCCICMLNSVQRHTQTATHHGCNEFVHCCMPRPQSIVVHIASMANTRTSLSHSWHLQCYLKIRYIHGALRSGYAAEHY